MKFNKWTLGLAAVGAVSMASAVRADETPTLVPLQTAVSSTVISGYVDVAAQYNPGNPGKAAAVNQPTLGYLNGASPANKVDNFSLNDVVISLDKPLDESPWASGYHVDVNTGADAVGINAGPTAVGIRQGYVTLRTPVGNGIDWKVGLFDGVTGYEGNTSYSNPNYTRSYGYEVNPASELGMIGSYKIIDGVSVQAGIADRYVGDPSGVPVGLSSKDFIFALALTAPDSWGFLKGSTLNAGTVQTFDNGGVNNYSVSATLATPVTGLKVGLAYDAVQSLRQTVGGLDGNIYGVYATYQATDKLAFNLRGEYVDSTDLGFFPPATSGPGVFDVGGKGEEITMTVEYDLWANVVSRVEARWDHTETGIAYNNGSGNGFTPSTENNFMLALNLVYKF